MMTPFAWAFLFTSLLLGSFLAANYLVALGVPFHWARKVAHLSAGVPIGLSPVVFPSMWYPAGLALAFLALLTLSHQIDLLPGVSRRGRWSEVGFPMAVLLCLTLWPISPWAAALPGLWVALGDGVAGLVRALVYKKPCKGLWGSVACIAVCSPFAVLVQPLWVGLLGAVGFTVVEYLSGDFAAIKIDDNLAAPVAAAAIMGVSLAVLG
jgi:hypothetical protein